MLLEAHEIGSGTTGNSTGNLYVTLSQGLHSIVQRWGVDVARELVAERAGAIDFIEAQSRGRRVWSSPAARCCSSRAPVTTSR